MSVSLISGASSDLLSIDATSKAARVTPYDTSGNYVHPSKVTPFSLGSYIAVSTSGSLGAGAQTNAEVYQFRWSDATRLCVLESITVNFLATTAYAAGLLHITATQARSFTAVGSGTGSSALTLSTNNTGKRKTTFSSSLVADTSIVVYGTAALSAGTKTFDNAPFAAIATNTTATNIFTNQVLYQRNFQGEYPIVFAQNEGFALRLTCPATGVGVLYVTTQWSEVTTSEL